MEKMRDNTDYAYLRRMVGTQAYVAKLLDVGVRTIQRRESGELPVSKEAYLVITLLAHDDNYEDVRRSPEGNEHMKYYRHHPSRNAVVDEFRPFGADPESVPKVAAAIERLNRRADEARTLAK